MGRGTFSRAAFVESTRSRVADIGPVTARAEQQARETGKLNPLVDPAGYGVIRLSLARMELQPNGLWMLTVGTPVPVETRVDTTGSMGGNVDITLRVMPNSYELISGVLPGCDLQIATGIFGDVRDRFVLCRPQYEMLADKIVEQLTLMVPERDGYDETEDPDYGIFGGAYLVDAYINRIGLKGYDFTVTDAPGRGMLDERQLLRVFGSEVFEKVKANGHQVVRDPRTKDVVSDLLKRAHAFLIQVEGMQRTYQSWLPIYGRERIVTIPDTELLPQVQACIIGLTEGTLGMEDVMPFLQKHGVDKRHAEQITKSVVNIPIGAQAALPNFGKRPKAGDLFKSKTDLWPLSSDEIAAITGTSGSVKKDKERIDWL